MHGLLGLYAADLVFSSFQASGSAENTMTTATTSHTSLLLRMLLLTNTKNDFCGNDSDTPKTSTALTTAHPTFDIAQVLLAPISTTVTALVVLVLELLPLSVICMLHVSGSDAAAEVHRQF